MGLGFKRRPDRRAPARGPERLERPNPAILTPPMLKVGGEVDSFCTRCSLSLAHTIIAMVGGRPVKVECNTCHSVHRFRGDAPAATSSRRATATRPPRERPATRSFEEELRGKNLAMARRYSSKETYNLDQVIEHPTFGLGFVSAIRDATKVEVTFRSEVKVLVHGKP
jgi:hypothetical protein